MIGVVEGGLAATAIVAAGLAISIAVELATPAAAAIRRAAARTLRAVGR